MRSLYNICLLVACCLCTVAVAAAQQSQSTATQAPPPASTTNYIPKFTNRTGGVADSVMYQSGSNVGIGITTPTANLEVDGTAKVDGSLTLGGSILSPSGAAVIQAPNNDSGNFSAGLGALGPATTGPSNTAVGNNALYSNTNGSLNTATGYNAMFANATGNYNTAAGYAAMFLNTIGSENSAFGNAAMFSNTTGNYNTAAGYVALYNNTTGGSDTANGANALASNTTGNSNTASGNSALQSNTAGSNNVAVGSFAGANIVSGSANIAVGYYAGTNVTSSNNIEIGNQGTSSDSGFIRIGTAGTQTSAFIAGIYGTATIANNAVPVVIDSNGNLGTISSSRRYKEDIRDMGDASSGLMSLRPVTFRYKKPFDDGSKPVQYGLIAEEVAEVYPDLVTRNADGQVETVKYQLLDSMLLNEVQKQNLLIAGQREEIQAQKGQMRLLEERLASLEAALQQSGRPR